MIAIEEIRQKLQSILGSDGVLSGSDAVAPYLYDCSLPYFRAEATHECVVARPENAEQISEIMKYANEKLIPVVVRGGGTGLCGAAIVTHPGIVISMERLDSIIEVDEKNFIITVESGVTLKQLNDYLHEHVPNMTFGSQPCDENAQIGGMVCENSGGIRTEGNSTTRSNVRGIEVVLPTGEITLFNGKMKRNNAGYDLMQLMIGSEGTLGIVTKIMLSVRPKLPCDATIIAAFDNYSQAADAVTMSLKTGIHLDGIEYMDRSTAKKCAANTGKTWPLNKGKVDLMFIVCAENEEAAFNICQMVESICSMAGAVESRTYDGAGKQKEFIEMRTTSLFATQNNMAETMDIAVPPAEVPRLMKVFHEISEKYNIVTDTVGHISEGNVHNNVYAEKDGSLPAKYHEMRDELYRAAIDMGGTISGEHGIGKRKREELRMQLDDIQVQLMRKIKNAFDPNNILTPDTAII